MSGFLIGTDPTLRKTKIPTVTTLTAGVGFTAGTSTAITLGADPGDEKNVVVTMDGVTQHRSTYSVSSTTLTFDAAIPTGTAEIEATFGVPVSSVTVADDAVTLAKMASGTDGNIISYDASGNPVAIATGSDGQVLHSAGAGAQPAFETLTTGSWSFVSTTVASSSSTVEFTGIDNTSDLWMVVISGANVSNDITGISCRTSNDTSSHSYDSGASDYNWTYQGVQGGTAYAKADQNDSEITFGEDPFLMGNDAENSLSARVYIHDPSDTTYDTQISCHIVALNNATDPWPWILHATGIRKTPEAVTAIQFFMSAGSFDTGRFSLYKLAHA